MDDKDNQYIARFKESLEVWTDERMITRAELYQLTRFTMYLVNLADDGGWVYAGHSLKVGVPMCTLVVKGWMDEVPVVVFTSARTPMGCVTTFMRKLDQDLLEWRDDKFRQ